MRTVRDTDPKSPRDPKEAFIARAQALTGKPLQGFENLKGLDFERLQGMSDEKMNSLVDLVMKFSPEEKGDVRGSISKVLADMGAARDVVDDLKENYGFKPEEFLDSLLKEKGTGYIKSGLIKGTAKATGFLRDGGRFRILKK
tara:strand:+ start:744 stop:1172 length:429 start_codon:yes stop_codon:yes gene_type:complete